MRALKISIINWAYNKMLKLSHNIFIYILSIAYSYKN